MGSLPFEVGSGSMNVSGRATGTQACVHKQDC